MVLQAAIQRSGVDPKVKFESSDHGDVVLAGLTKLRNMEQLFDVVLIVENERFPAHRVVLASCSDYFRAMFTDGLLESRLDEIQLNGVTALGMRNLIDFAYSSKILIDSENVEHVLSAANHVQILPVVEACVNFLKSHLVLSNCVDMITVSELFSLDTLRSHVYIYVSQHLNALALTSEFLTLSSSQLEKLLDMNYAVDCAEIDVFSAVIGWILHHHGYSAKHALKYLSKVNISGLLPHEIESMNNFKEFEKMFFDHISGWKLQSFIKSTIGTNIVKVEGLLNIRGYEESVVVCGGFLPGSGMSNDVQYYNTDSGTLHYLTTVPHVEQCNFGMTTVNNRLYVVGGCYNDDQMEELIHGYGFSYDPQSKLWKTITPMINERCRFYLGAVGHKLYAIGGDTSATVEPMDYSKCECYDPTSNRWSPIAMLPGNRTDHAGTVLGDYLYISGGLQDPEGPTFNTFYKYHPSTDTWTQLPFMLTPRAHHTMFVYNDKIYVIGGCFEDPITNQRIMASAIDCFNPQTEQWEEVARVPSPRLFASYTVFCDKIVVIGGWLNGDYKRKCRNIQTFDLIGQKGTNDMSSATEIWEHTSCSIYLPICKA